LEAEGFKTVGPRAASFAVWGFGEAARFAKVAGFREVMWVGDLPCVGEFFKISDSPPASLTAIGGNTEAAIAAMMVRRQGQTAKHAANPALTNFLPDDSNLAFPQSDFPFRASRRHGGMRRHYQLF
jgi:hypothetical protein